MAEWFRALDLKSGGPWFKSSTLLLSGFVLGRCLVSSVGRAPVCCAGGRGFEPQTGPTLKITEENVLPL